jgi:hypothetical protein
VRRDRDDHGSGVTVVVGHERVRIAREACEEDFIRAFAVRYREIGFESLGERSRGCAVCPFMHDNAVRAVHRVRAASRLLTALARR